MSRARRSFEAMTSCHITMRCNNQAFDLRRDIPVFFGQPIGHTSAAGGPN
jgi:hypothetical protein